MNVSVKKGEICICFSIYKIAGQILTANFMLVHINTKMTVSKVALENFVISLLFSVSAVKRGWREKHVKIFLSMLKSKLSL